MAGMDEFLQAAADRTHHHGGWKFTNTYTCPRPSLPPAALPPREPLEQLLEMQKPGFLRASSVGRACAVGANPQGPQQLVDTGARPTPQPSPLRTGGQGGAGEALGEGVQSRPDHPLSSHRIPTAYTWGAVGTLGLAWAADWRLILDWVPYVNGRFKKDD